VWNWKILVGTYPSTFCPHPPLSGVLFESHPRHLRFLFFFPSPLRERAERNSALPLILVPFWSLIRGSETSPPLIKPPSIPFKRWSAQPPPSLPPSTLIKTNTPWGKENCAPYLSHFHVWRSHSGSRRLHLKRDPFKLLHTPTTHLS
jgi:hypothetical protein